MMIFSSLRLQQDTLQIRNVIRHDSIRIKTDSLSTIKVRELKDSVIQIPKPVQKKSTLDVPDTTLVCSRNSIADITFYNPNNIKINRGLEAINRFPFLFIEKNRQMQIDERISMTKHLKNGQDLPNQSLHDDWMIGIILVAALLYSLIRTASRGIWQSVSRFFLFRGINEPTSRELDGIFQLRSTIHNLFSFLIIGLFTYCASIYFDISPLYTRGILIWFVSLGIIIASITLRHIICVTTGIISGEKDAFREYLDTVYQSYRLVAIILFVPVVLILYTAILPLKIGIITGLIVIGIIYLIRIIRLMMIFIIRKISIFYLILYLCALEILPVLILMKYFSGLI